MESISYEPETWDPTENEPEEIEIETAHVSVQTCQMEPKRGRGALITKMMLTLASGVLIVVMCSGLKPGIS